MTFIMSESDRQVLANGVCLLCRGTHYGSFRCPFRCEQCTVNTGICQLDGCPRAARIKSEDEAATLRAALRRAENAPTSPEALAAECDRLRARLEEVEKERDRVVGLHKALMKAADDRLEACEREAARYRWLREAAIRESDPPQALQDATTPEEIDAAIDAALKPAGGEGNG